MTLFIGTLFLPYTVKFEVNADDKSLLESELEINSAESHRGSAKLDELTTSAIKSSILPSLSSNSASPVSANRSSSFSNTRSGKDTLRKSDLFASARESKPDNISPGDNISEKSSLHLVQPRSRFSSPIVSSSVNDNRKNSLDGLPGMKFSRSGSGSGSGSGRSPSISTSTDSLVSKGTKVGNSKLNRGFKNDSIEYGVFEEEYESELNQRFPDNHAFFADSGSFLEDEDEVVGKLAPFGGFSRANMGDIVLGQDNLFERAPWQIVKTDRGNGSLINAVGLALSKGVISNCKWVGAMSSPNDLIPAHVLKDIKQKLSDEFDCESVSIDDYTFQGHYSSFCKQILWPTLHYQIPDDPKSKAFEEHSYHFYKSVNQMVADKLIENYKNEVGDNSSGSSNNTIWIHDYHLLLVPAMVRKALPDAKIGLFLHVSFPSSEVFRCLAQRKSLLEGMLGADSICFQNEEYVRHFLQTCNRLLLTDSDESGLMYRGKFVKVSAIPVGIDAKELERTLHTDDVAKWSKMIRSRWPNQKLIVSRDKLDKLRGIKQKLLAYERFLHNNRSYLGSAVLLQIFMGNSNDEPYESEVTQIISRINAQADNISVVPPVFTLHQDIEFDQYVALQEVADVFIVSSMREGLNLTCQEFIISTSQKKSPLILSEFTGSSSLLGCKDDGALLLNPWAITDFSQKIKQALEMSDQEKLKRWKNCHEVVIKHNSLDWVRGCLKALEEGWELSQRRTSAENKPFTKEIFEKFSYNEGRKLFVVNIDDLSDQRNDGSSAQKAVVELSTFGSILRDLSSDESKIVFFASITRKSELDLVFKTFPQVGLIAEFGGYIKFPNSSDWISLVNESRVQSWIPSVAQVLKTKSEGLLGSKVVVDDCSVKFVAQTSMMLDPKRSLDVMGECVQLIDESFGSTKELHASIINSCVVVRQKYTSEEAFSFLLSYYTKSLVSDSDSENSRISDLIKSMGQHGESVSDTEKVKHCFYAGGLNPIDEDIYDVLEALEKNKSIDSALTVAIWNGMKGGRTSAKYVTLGQNELLLILSKQV